MKKITSNDVLESFGMKDLKLEEIMEIDAGCGIRIGCGDKCTCKSGTYQTYCPSNGNNNGNGNTIIISGPDTGCSGKTIYA